MKTFNLFLYRCIMKTSIEHLPDSTQRQLGILKNLILHSIENCHMIILFGSYSRGNYVLRDDKVKFGVNTTYISDYDILIILNRADTIKTEKIIREKVKKKFNAY